MIDVPERIFVTWPQPNATGLAFTSNAKNRTEYARADLHRNALEAEKARADAAEQEAHACGAERAAWKERAEAAEAALKTARGDALREAGDPDKLDEEMEYDHRAGDTDNE